MGLGTSAQTSNAKNFHGRRRQRAGCNCDAPAVMVATVFRCELRLVQQSWALPGQAGSPRRGREGGGAKKLGTLLRPPTCILT